MKKRYILIGIFIVFIMGITIIGSLVVTGNKRIVSNKDILEVQTNKEVYFTPYGYSIDNPNVILNPYGNSPLTALIMFETDDYSEVSIKIKGKNDDDINYSFEKNKYHMLPIYGLYPEYENTIIITSEGKTNSVIINTNGLPEDFEYFNNESNTFEFYNINYPYIIDSYGNVRWYLNSNYYGNITMLDNSNIIIGSDKYNEKGNSISFYEMNLLGKIYNEYVIKDGYYGQSAILDDEVIVLSSKVLGIDLQTGEEINNYIDNDSFDSVIVKDNRLMIKKDNILYDIKDNKLVESSEQEDNIIISFYNNVSNYNIIKPNRFGKLLETKTSNKYVSLLNYNRKDKLNVTINKEINRIVVNNNNEESIYVILDKFLDKRVYEVKDVLYINDTGLNGKYTIYYKIKNKIYKTDYYVEVNNE